MKLLVLSLSVPVLALAIVASSMQAPSGGQQKPADKKPAAEPSPQEMMAAMMKAGTPGAEHKALEPFVGTWSAKVTMWMDPSQPAQESSGTMVNSWVYDGRYLEHKFEGDMGGEKFAGTGLWGFDVAAGKYIGFWYDSMSTGLSNSTGTASADGKKFTMTSVMTDPMTGKPATGDEVITLDGPDKHTMEMFEDRGGKKVKTMEIVYTRKK